MRKTLLVIAVLLITTQAFGASVTLSVVDEGDGWAAIRYSADANVSAFGLKVTADSGADFNDIKDYNVGECTASVQGYGIFPGTIDINESTGVVDYNGLPVAPNTAPGASGSGLGTDTLILEMGALYVEGNEPAQSGTLIAVHVTGDCNVCVEGEPIRGNVVFTDSTSVDPCMACEHIAVGPPPCFYVGLVDKCGHTVTAAEVATWVSLGEPNCWCYDCHCAGDTNGDNVINSTDLAGTGAGDGWFDAWNTAYHPCSDTNYDGVINSTDLAGVGALDGWFNGWYNGCP
jgi:hypothetical protein